jgi:SAM-dependent methyltransferase
MLAERRDTRELMDAEDLPAETYAAVLRDLSRVNSLTLARRPTLDFLARATSGQRRGAPWRLLDVGFGDGDMLRAIARWAARRDQEFELVGIDLNARSAEVARARGPGGAPIRWLTGDYADLADEPWDFVISSLVAHHMSQAELIAFLRFMEVKAAKGWLINDLHRHGFAYLGFPLLARLAGWHPIVRSDGRTSIARSYRPHEWSPLLGQAGIKDARVRRCFPFRLCVEHLR